MQTENDSLRNQRPRGSRPDGAVEDKWFLIKNVTELRLTHQIRLLTFMASQESKRLIIRVPKDAIIHPTLKAFVDEKKKVVAIEPLVSSGTVPRSI